MIGKSTHFKLPPHTFPPPSSLGFSNFFSNGKLCIFMDNCGLHKIIKPSIIIVKLEMYYRNVARDLYKLIQISLFHNITIVLKVAKDYIHQQFYMQLKSLTKTMHIFFQTTIIRISYVILFFFSSIIRKIYLQKHLYDETQNKCT